MEFSQPIRFIIFCLISSIWGIKSRKIKLHTCFLPRIRCVRALIDCYYSPPFERGLAVSGPVLSLSCLALSFWIPSIIAYTDSQLLRATSSPLCAFVRIKETSSPWKYSYQIDYRPRRSYITFYPIRFCVHRHHVMRIVSWPILISCASF